MVTAVQPVLREVQGAVVRIAPLTQGEIPALFEAIGVPEVFAGGYGGGPAGYRDTLEGFTEFALGYYRWEQGNVYGVWVADRLVGTSTLSDFEPRREAAHLGWTAYAPDTWGSAVNPETKLLILDEAFGNGWGRVKLQADALNARSRAAILKLGATFEGITRRDQPRADGSWRDAAVFSILAEEWPEVRAALQARVAATAATGR